MHSPIIELAANGSLNTICSGTYIRVPCHHVQSGQMKHVVLGVQRLHVHAEQIEKSCETFIAIAAVERCAMQSSHASLVRLEKCTLPQKMK